MHGEDCSSRLCTGLDHCWRFRDLVEIDDVEVRVQVAWDVSDPDQHDRALDYGAFMGTRTPTSVYAARGPPDPRVGLCSP